MFACFTEVKITDKIKKCKKITFNEIERFDHFIVMFILFIVNIIKYIVILFIVKPYWYTIDLGAFYGRNLRISVIR
jgi:hypothetical protein